MTELEKYKKALVLASEVAAKGDYCPSRYCPNQEWKCVCKDCAICWQEFFLKQAEQEND